MVEKLSALRERTLTAISKTEIVCEATRNMLDNFRAQRTFHTDNLQPVKKEVRAVYRRFNKKVTISF